MRAYNGQAVSVSVTAPEIVYTGAVVSAKLRVVVLGGVIPTVKAVPDR